jgi:heme exporter protein C
VTKFDKPSIHIDMLIPLLLMAGAFKVFFAISLLLRTRNELLERELPRQWVKQLVEENDG